VRVLAGEAQRGPVIAVGFIVAALATLTLTVPAGLPPLHVAPPVALMLLAAIAYRFALRWYVLLGLVITVVLFIPIRRYTMPGDLPFELEPYRILIALVCAGWLLSLLVDPRVRFRRSGLEAPIALFGLAVIFSLVANLDRLGDPEVETHVIKSVTFFTSFFLVFFLIVSVVKTRREIDVLTKVLVAGGAVVAFFAVIENRTGYNLFDHLSGVIPLLELSKELEIAGRGARLRAYASAEHPIALAAALVLLIPLSVYLARSAARRLLWCSAGLMLFLGALATMSRTTILMLVAMLASFLILRPRETRRFWPALLPLVIVVHFALPATLGPLKDSFFPAGGLIAEQQSSPGTRSQGRIADLGPAMEEFARSPLAGQGFATRIVKGDTTNALEILDDQWLATLLETGVLGAGALLWMFLRFIRRAGREAKRDTSDDGWFLVAITASVTSFAVGMLTFDAFAFIQVTFLLFVLLGLGVAALGSARASEPATGV
jgi:polysaccharide biosynthesis protein PslJ